MTLLFWDLAFVPPCLWRLRRPNIDGSGMLREKTQRANLFGAAHEKTAYVQPNSCFCLQISLVPFRFVRMRERDFVAKITCFCFIQCVFYRRLYCMYYAGCVPLPPLFSYPHLLSELPAGRCWFSCRGGWCSTAFKLCGLGRCRWSEGGRLQRRHYARHNVGNGGGIHDWGCTPAAEHVPRGRRSTRIHACGRS